MKLREKYKTWEGAQKRASFENALAPGEFARGDAAYLYQFTIIKEGDVWRVERKRALGAPSTQTADIHNGSISAPITPSC